MITEPEKCIGSASEGFALLQMQAALEAAKKQLITLGTGGDLSDLSEGEAHECGVDMIQWAVLRQINAALALL